MITVTTTIAVLLLSAAIDPSAAAFQRPAPPQVSADRDRAALLADASSALTAGRRADAKRLLQEAATRFHSVVALLQLARLQSGDGDASGALESLRAARTLAPNSEDVLSAYAQLALAAQLPVPAAGALEALTRMCPETAQYEYLLGVALMTAGYAVRATDALQAADRLEPGRPLTLAALGLVFNNRKQFADAKDARTRSLEMDPDRAETLAALAEAEAAIGDLADAEVHAQRALAVSPSEATAHLVIGMVRLQQQRYPESRDALLAAAADDPRAAKVDYQLSLVYARLGDAAAAERSLKSYQQKLAVMNERVKALRDATGARDKQPGGDR